MATQVWQVQLWQDGGHRAYSHGQFCSIFSVALFIELSRAQPDFVAIFAPADASDADLDWIRAELSRVDRCHSPTMRFAIALIEAEPGAPKVQGAYHRAGERLYVEAQCASIEPLIASRQLE